MSLRVDGGLEVSMVKRAANRAVCRLRAPRLLSPIQPRADYCKRQQALTDEMGEAFATLDWEYRITYANKAVLQFFGLRLDEVIGTSFWEIFPETSAMPVGAAVREAMALGRSSSKEYVSPKVGRWVEARVYPTTSGVCIYLRDIDERKCKELERDGTSGRSANRGRFQSVLGAMDDGFIIYDREWRYLYINDRAVAQTQRPREELIGRVFWDVFPDVVGTEIYRNLTEVAASGEARSYEVYYEPYDEWFEHRVFPDPAGTAVFIHSITERKRAEQTLRESEQRLRRFYEAGLVGVIYWNTDGEIVNANDRFLEITGYTREELEAGAIDWLAMTPPEFACLDERSLLELQADGVNSAPFEKEYLRKDGTRVPIILAGAMLDEERHNGVAFVLDISERKRAEAALREGEERFRLLHDTLLQGVVYQNADGTIISMNPAAERILGKRPEDFVGSTSVAVEHDTLREDGSPFPGLEHPAMIALRTGKPVPDVLMQVYNPRESRYRLITIQAVPLFRPGEESPYRVYAVFDDVTERQRLLEESLTQAGELVSARAELQQELETAHLLSEAAESLTKSLALNEILDRLARIILDVSGHTRVTISLWREHTRRLEVVSALGNPVVPIGLLVTIDGLSDPAKQAIDGRESTLSDHDALEPGRRGIADRVDSHLALYVPIYFGDRFVALLAIDDPGERREFSNHERSLIEGIGAQAAVALENARLFEAEQTAQRQAEAELARTRLLQQVAVAATTSTSLDDVTDRVLQAILEGNCI